MQLSTDSEYVRPGVTRGSPGGTRTGWRFSARADAAQLNRSGVVRLFDPYLRPKSGDVGRGLALARAVFQVHGGDLEAQLEGDVLVLRGRAPKTPGEAT